MNRVFINGNNLTIEDVVNVCRNNYEVIITEEAIINVKKSRELVDKLVDEGKDFIWNNYRIWKIF